MFTTEEIQRLKNRLLPLNAHTTHINVQRFAERLPEAITKSIAPLQFEIYSGSSGEIEAWRENASYDADPRHPHLFAPGLRHVLGLPATSIRPSSIYHLNMVEANGEFARINREYFWQGNDTIEFSKTTYTRPILYVHPEVLNVLQDYIKTFQQDFDNAVQILASHHPNISPNLLRLTLYHLVLLELNLYDSTDAKQDLAAAHSIHSPDQQMYWDAFVDWQSPLNALSGTWAGSYGWLALSFGVLATDEQGFGPIQIIPKLLQKAYADKTVYDGFATFLPKEKLATPEARLETCLNPRASIYAKAMTLDLQLNQFDDKPNWIIPIVHKPYFPNADDAHQFAMLFGAMFLVQRPEASAELKQEMVAGNTYIAFAYSLFILSDVMQIHLGFTSVDTYAATDCPVAGAVGSHAGSYFKDGERTQECVRSQDLHPTMRFHSSAE